MADLYKYSALFLDRDGVINVHRQDDYVKTWKEFAFEEGVLDALSILGKFFDKIIIVTNQRGVGRGIMSEEELLSIHEKMCESIASHGGRIDAIYYCTDTDSTSPNRKPNTGMGLQAKRDFPKIDFARSYMAGDSHSDMEFGKRLGMKTILISKDSEFGSLSDFAHFIKAHHP
ncbi:MAG: HAD family hydrolase [Rikenellaceae bacterium]|nr:HAD family hydrolase [Rikenellaceae bacterium]